ncbi:MAG TPA: SGNH/GDSL hydrolase family protein [Pyrinomonadaceae bacterium]
MQRQLHEYHPLIGYRFIPHLTARVAHESGGYLVQTNEIGFRCEHPAAPRKTPDTFRILLFGDSMTAGDGVSNHKRFGDVLEKRLEGSEVLNFGLSGSGTDQQFLIFREFARELEYDLLLICPFVENIRRVISRYRLATTREDERAAYIAKPYFELERGSLRLRHVPVPKGLFSEYDLPPDAHQHVDNGGPSPALRKVLNTSLKPFKHLVHGMGYGDLQHYDRPDEPAWLLLKALLRQWLSENGERPAVICPIPLYAHIEQTASPESYLRRFGELAEPGCGVVVCDPLPRFWALTPEERWRCRFPQDIHFSPFGHAVMADALQPCIEQFLSKGCA